MKKCFIMICCVVLSMLMAGVSVSAAEATPAQFVVTANDAAVGETVIVTVSVSENSYFSNGTILVHYDPTKLTFVDDSCAAGAAAPTNTMAMAVAHPDKSYVKAAIVSTGYMVSGGEVMVMEFTANSAEETTLSLTFEECCGDLGDGNIINLSYTAVPYTINAPRVTDASGNVVTVPTVTNVSVNGGETVATTAVASEGNSFDVTLWIVIGVVAGAAVIVTVILVAMNRKKKTFSK